MNNFNIKLPDDVQFIIHTLQLHGFEAYAVGGCVRDSILGREPGDWDITTSAMPEETKALFDRTFDTGIEHGTITVLLNHEGYDVQNRWKIRRQQTSERSHIYKKSERRPAQTRLYDQCYGIQ